MFVVSVLIWLFEPFVPKGLYGVGHSALSDLMVGPRWFSSGWAEWIVLVGVAGATLILRVATCVHHNRRAKAVGQGAAVNSTDPGTVCND